MYIDHITALFVGITTAFFGLYAFQIFRVPQRTRLQTVIGYIFVFRTILALKGIFSTLPSFRQQEILDLLIVIDGLKAITLVIFLFELVTPGWATRRRIVITSIPVLALFTVYVIWPSRTMMYIYITFIIAYGIYACIYTWGKARRYVRYIRENYSNIDNIDIKWLNYVMMISISGQIIWVIATFNPTFQVDIIYYISLIVMYQIVLDHCLQQKPIKIEEPEQPDVTPQLTTPKEYVFAGKMEAMVENQQLYLNKDLTLTDIARSVQTNRTYLSDYFTRVKQQTFYDYINQLRIEQMAIPMLQQHPEYTIDYIATESGFNSISTFRRAFTKITGKSPGQYRAEMTTP